MIAQTTQEFHRKQVAKCRSTDLELVNGPHRCDIPMIRSVSHVVAINGQLVCVLILQIIPTLPFPFWALLFQFVSTIVAATPFVGVTRIVQTTCNTSGTPPSELDAATNSDAEFDLSDEEVRAAHITKQDFIRTRRLSEKSSYVAFAWMRKA